ncbi:MAG: toast rack family protein [Bryobacteraceae bacterium]
MKPRVRALWPAAAILLLIVATGCVQNGAYSGDTKYEPVSVPLGASKRADVHLDMGAGELVLRGGAQDLIQGTLAYTAPDRKPIVDTSNEGSDTSVHIKEPSGVHFGPHMHYRWNLQVNDDPRLKLEVNCGAGKASLELGSLALESVKVNMGAGEVDVDLRGKPSQSYDVHVSGGVGKATIWLPSHVGIRADAHGVLGSIDVVGLEKTGGHYENGLYNHSDVNIHVTVDGAIGEIRLIG